MYGERPEVADSLVTGCTGAIAQVCPGGMEEQQVSERTLINGRLSEASNYMRCRISKHTVLFRML